MYEKHIVYDQLTPFIFHRDTVTKDLHFSGNWHKNIEILYFIEGNGEVICNMETDSVTVGDIFVINSNDVHSTRTDNLTRYYCLIVDTAFCIENGVNVDEIKFCRKIKDKFVEDKYKAIVEAFKERNSEYYKTKLRIAVLDLLVAIAEKHTFKGVTESNVKQTDVIRTTLEYINENYKNEITIEELSKFAGYSRAHFSRQFKLATGMPIVEYINYVRCINAHDLLINGEMNIGEIASECGFKNASYFSKIYKRIIGRLPSEDIK